MEGIFTSEESLYKRLRNPTVMYHLASDRGIINLWNESGYRLTFADGEIVFFDFPFADQRIAVTGHAAREYPEIVIDKSLQYVEPGAGLGQFIPFLVGQKIQHRPIVIDVANYRSMAALLRHARSERIGGEETLDEWLAVTDVLLDPAKVRLYQCTLGDALVKYPELIGCADVVVDKCGPFTHELEDLPVLDLERRLLKPEGIIYQRNYVETRIYRLNEC